ncbi:MAG: FKBP-type peptidyl-prolyl cis-trans isomerase [Bacteroidetes bacterium]|nr:FKBP-type peptidyl-prolyl cis-trans isomerase [Bacteroidota bacterium]
MKTISSYLLGSLVLLGAVSCTNSEFKKTKSGLLYKIYSDGKGETAKKGQFLKANVVQKLRDSILYSSEGNMPVYMPVDSPRPVYSPVEIFSLLRKNDSAVCVELADTLQRKFGGAGQMPPWLKKKDKITFTFKILDVFASEELLTADRNAEMGKQKDREIKQVEGYLAKNNIQAQKTDRGTYVVVNSVGDGAQVDSGKQISVRYTGKLLPSGKEFESNMKGPGNEPFKFVVGAGQIIPGWDDGLRKFKKGGKGTLYIPAFLAYDQQMGPGRTPFENLIFDVEIVDVTDAPPPAAPAMPNNMPTMPVKPTK